MAIPGVFKPVEMDDMLLVDGGLLNNLPVDVVRRMGADVVIAIDLTQNKREAKDGDMPSGRSLKKYVEWIINRPDLQKYNENINNIDVYINPDLKGFDAASFTGKKIDKMIQCGEAAGHDAEKELKALHKRIYSTKK